MKKIFIIISIAVVLLITLQTKAQSTSNDKFIFSGYGELYYSLDFGFPSQHQKDNYLINHKRHNELNANILMVKGNYNEKNTRANLGLMVGNYAQYNLPLEPSWAQFVYEANAGIKISKRKNLWLDAGIMPSHMGFEGVIGTDCWTLTRSLVAENSPYYQAGIKLGYTNAKENLMVGLFVLNGWQRIVRDEGVHLPSLGLQVNYKTNNNWTLNYSNYIGSDQPWSESIIRNFHNLYAIYEPKKKWQAILGFDIGADVKNGKYYSMWYAPVGILRYHLNKKSRIGLRGEYYNDAEEAVVVTGTPNGFQVSGISTNYDYQINQRFTTRVEVKHFLSKDKIFDNKANNFSATANLCVKF